MTPTTNPVAPIETMAREQIGRVADRFAAHCSKKGPRLTRNAVQMVLEKEGKILAQEMFDLFCRRVERHGRVIIRRVKVNRDLTPEQMVAATGRKQILKAGVLATLPRQGSGIEDFVMFFVEADRYLTVEEQKKFLADHGLKPDYYGQIQACIDDPELADKYPNCMQWDFDGKVSSFIDLDRAPLGPAPAGRNVSCGRCERLRDNSWWYAGR